MGKLIKNNNKLYLTDSLLCANITSSDKDIKQEVDTMSKEFKLYDTTYTFEESVKAPYCTPGIPQKCLKVITVNESGDTDCYHVYGWDLPGTEEDFLDIAHDPAAWEPIRYDDRYRYLPDYLVGIQYEDYDGIWLITATDGDAVTVKCIQASNINFGKEFTVSLDEVLFFLGMDEEEEEEE